MLIRMGVFVHVYTCSLTNKRSHNIIVGKGWTKRHTNNMAVGGVYLKTEFPLAKQFRCNVPIIILYT